ncbi:hypothetical protein ACIRL2_48725 [Embleya sp. NPDC127516]|uniref:hypothetical protein n=1 Tax=Embleya sp. NPDC127516 TaxID=3363990 RepID=UPI00382C7721
MRAEDVAAVVVAVVVPVLTATVAVFAVAWQDRQASRSQTGRRQRAFEDATRQVDFAVLWWDARQRLPGNQEELANASRVAQRWLDQAGALVVAAGPGTVDPPRRLSPTRLLLLYPFRYTAAKFIRASFLAALGVMAVTSVGVLSMALSTGTGADFGWSLTWLLLFALIALSLRFWAVSADAVRQP